MVTEPMHGPVALAIFWTWLGFTAAGVVAYSAYRLLRPWLNKLRKPPSQPAVKYAAQLQQRMRKKPSRQEGASPASDDKAPTKK
jgi:membrane protein implicated in regulation of membrane protease activity